MLKRNNEFTKKKFCDSKTIKILGSRNPGNTGAATNPVFNILMTSNDLKGPLKLNVLTMALCISNES